MALSSDDLAAKGLVPPFVDEQATRLNGARGRPSYEVTFQGKPPKLILPEPTGIGDTAGHRAWVSAVWRLDPSHPVTGAERQGLRGPDGHIVVRRGTAPPIRFEPASALSTAKRMSPALQWQLLPTDGEPYGFKDEHCRRIATVVARLCGAHAGRTEADEAAAIVGALTIAGTPVEGHTVYGTGAERYEAARALRRDVDERIGRPIGPTRFLLDRNTGELVIAVSDLQATARAVEGSSLPRGWLDGRIAELGWRRRRLDGHAYPGRAGRQGRHARIDVYIGHLPDPTDGTR